ncbi:hypothetical protein BDR06DRAFT_977954 [Suillus hirtellus]|nr:hypothetical protein BDR06DRAFT_977954 [Suillus hirtellus]
MENKWLQCVTNTAGTLKCPFSSFSLAHFVVKNDISTNEAKHGSRVYSYSPGLLLSVASTADGPPSDERLPSTLPRPPFNVSPLSLGSKFAAHLFPSRSPIKILEHGNNYSLKQAF